MATTSRPLHSIIWSLLFIFGHLMKLFMKMSKMFVKFLSQCLEKSNLRNIYENRWKWIVAVQFHVFKRIVHQFYKKLPTWYICAMIQMFDGIRYLLRLLLLLLELERVNFFNKYVLLCNNVHWWLFLQTFSDK